MRFARVEAPGSGRSYKRLRVMIRAGVGDVGTGPNRIQEQNSEQSRRDTTLDRTEPEIPAIRLQCTNDAT